MGINLIIITLASMEIIQDDGTEYSPQAQVLLIITIILN